MGVALLPRPRRGEPGGVEVTEVAEERPLVRCCWRPLSAWLMSISWPGGGVDCTHFRLEGGGLSGGGDRELAGLFMALDSGWRWGHA